jgi:hypothetical protein
VLQRIPQLEGVVPVADQDSIVNQTNSFGSFDDDSYIGVYFDQLDKDGGDIQYTLRFPYEASSNFEGWDTDEVTDDFTSTLRRSESLYMHGFTIMEKALDESIIEYFAQKEGKTVPDIILNMRVCV